MRGVTLGKMIDDYRAETGLSLNPSMNTQQRDVQVKLLQRVQERLWEEFTWPHLRVWRDVPITAGQRYYDTPVDLHIDRLEKIEVYRDSDWHRLNPNLDTFDYNTYNSDLGERSWPPCEWRITEDEQTEIWPISDRSKTTGLEGTIRFTGIKKLAPFIANDDRCDLDGTIIVLFAAAESLARAGAKDAQVKLDQANAMLQRQKSGMTPKRKTLMFGVRKGYVPHRMYVKNYVPFEEH